MLLAMLLVLLDGVLSATSSLLRTPSRVVPITEDTATSATGTSPSTYPFCTSVNTAAISKAITVQSDECAIKTTYDWTSPYLPTNTERRELCTCTDLIKKLQTVTVPRCTLYKSGQLYSYAQVVTYAFGLCSVGGTSSSSSTSTTTTTTTSPSSVASDSSSPSTDSNTSSDEKKSSNKGVLIGVILAAVLVVVIVAAVAAYRCGRRGRDQGKTPTNEDGSQNDNNTMVEYDVVNAMPLSPLDGIATTTTYTVVADTDNDGAAKHKTRTRTSTNTTASTAATATGTSSLVLANTPRASEVGMWDDPAIVAVRVPFDAVFFDSLISRGGYGQVYKGSYKGDTVAIKQLLPERRKDLTQIDLFLREIKLLSTLDHERIVAFIGVAWNALSDVCVVVEYMENGDLRGVLQRWHTQSNDDNETRRPLGFDYEKLKIALHVAHALTYLHSLQPVVVHRDLKSKNILLNANYDAKLTDFGVSRERIDATMTAGVGSSLWMAPEVMMGERYNEKADVFSFGVVLSELDSHTLPYATAKEPGTERKIPDSAILQMVSLGRLRISFSAFADPEVVQLGLDCVALDPKKRPTSAEVLHRVHKVLRRV